MSTTVQPTYTELVQIVHDLHHRLLVLEVAADTADRPRPVDANTTGPHVRGSATSRNAALANQPRTGTQRRRILDHLIDQGDHGATRQEIAAELGMSDDSVRPRVVELIDGSWITVSNFTRATPLGEQAEVLIATVHARREAPLKVEQVRHAVSPSPVLTDEPEWVRDDLLGGELPASGSSVSTGRPSMYDPLGDAA